MEKEELFSKAQNEFDIRRKDVLESLLNINACSKSKLADAKSDLIRCEKIKSILNEEVAKLVSSIHESEQQLNNFNNEGMLLAESMRSDLDQNEQGFNKAKLDPFMDDSNERLKVNEVQIGKVDHLTSDFGKRKNELQKSIDDLRELFSNLESRLEKYKHDFELTGNRFINSVNENNDSRGNGNRNLKSINRGLDEIGTLLAECSEIKDV